MTMDHSKRQGGLNFLSKKVTGKSAKKRPRGRPRIHKHRVLTNAEMCRRYRQRKRQRVFWRHGSDLWSTPQEFYDRLHAEFGFGLDACAIAENAKCDRYFSPEQDGLVQDWGQANVWCNPPYSQVARWIAKAYEASKAGATVVALVYASVDTRWWQDFVAPYAEVRFPSGRLKFGGSARGAPRPSAVVIFRPAAGADPAPGGGCAG
jgi:phage N-6-adenine-methyltransferase